MTPPSIHGNKSYAVQFMVISIQNIYFSSELVNGVS
jgi:hypothetical protein